MKKISFGIMKFDYISLLYLAFLAYFNEAEFLLVLFFSISLHEIFHIVAIKISGCKINSITISIFGAEIIRSKKLTSYKNDIIIYLSGISANFILAVIAVLLIRTTHMDIYYFALYANFFIIALNILPIETLDGYNAVNSFLLMKYEMNTVDRIMSIISNITLFILIVAAIYILYITKYNFSLIIVALKLFEITVCKRKKPWKTMASNLT